jgi:cytochrome c biogenesis protein CcmG/thiol:disulfide interchange protein DsbE
VRRFWAGIVLAVLLMAGCDRGDHPGNIGKAAPQFVMSDGTRTVDLSKFRGRVVLLNLWATYCAPCIEELPSLLALQKKMPDIAVVAVSMDQDPDVYRKFLVDHHVDVLTVRDGEMKVNALYGTVQIPETYVIDRQGVLRRKFVGAQDWTKPEIMDFLRKM